MIGRLPRIEVPVGPEAYAGIPNHPNLSEWQGLFLRAYEAGLIDLNPDRPAKTRDYVRLSSAGICARQISYLRFGAPVEPFGLDGRVNTTLGTEIHRAIDKGWDLIDLPEGLVVESEFAVEETFETKNGPITIFGSGDTKFTQSGKCVVVAETKSLADWMYRAAVGAKLGGEPPMGPKREHILQGALSAYTTEVDLLVVHYVPKQPLPAGLRDEVRFNATWVYPRSQWEPMVVAELERLAGIMNLDGIAARMVPAGGATQEIINPGAGVYMSATGPQTYWGCQWCQFSQKCMADGPGRTEYKP